MNEIKIIPPYCHAIFLLNSAICASLLQLRPFIKRFRTLAISDFLLRHVCPSVRPHETTRLSLEGFREILYNLGELKCVEKIQICLNPFFA